MSKDDQFRYRRVKVHRLFSITMDQDGDIKKLNEQECLSLKHTRDVLGTGDGDICKPGNEICEYY